MTISSFFDTFEGFDSPMRDDNFYVLYDAIRESLEYLSSKRSELLKDCSVCDSDTSDEDACSACAAQLDLFNSKITHNQEMLGRL